MYETGIFMASLAWLYSVVITTTQLNSRMAENLATIGLRLSWATMEPKPLTGTYKRHGALWKIGKFTLIHGINLIFVLTSWAYVAYFVGSVIYRLSQDAGKPLAIKELQWKLKNYHMSFDQLVEEFYKVSLARSQSLEDYKNETLQQLRENEAL